MPFARFIGKTNVLFVIVLQEYRATGISTFPCSPVSLRFKFNTLTAGDISD